MTLFIITKINKGMLTNSTYEPFLDEVFKKYQINTPLRKAHFLAQIHHESGGFKSVSESLYYSDYKRLPTIFKSPFDLNKNGRVDLHELEFAKGYAKNSVKLANYVYANRMGNGNEASGDGYKYRGKGLIQLTGKTTQEEYARFVNVDTNKRPEFLTEPKYALDSAGWFWNRASLNQFADKDDVKTITKRINGGYNGLEDRIEKVKYYKKKLGI